VRYFEDMPVGLVEPVDATYLVTEAEIVEMGERWDPQPFHTDREAAAASIFGGLVASSVHLFGITARLGMQGRPKAAVSSLGFRDLQNHAPARPGDELSVSSTVVASRPSQSRPGTGVVTIRAELRNQHGELVFSFENTALYAGRPG
jgi:acyl dehydratase